MQEPGERKSLIRESGDEGFKGARGTRDGVGIM